MNLKTKKLNNDTLFENVLFYLHVGKTAQIKVTGTSMLPFLDQRYDDVILEPIDFKDIKIGAIVLARINNSKYYLHRIINIEGDLVTLMGDGNIKQTEQCYKNDIKAIVKKRIRNNRTVDMTTPAFDKNVQLWLKFSPIRRLLLALYNLLTDRKYIRKLISNK